MYNVYCTLDWPAGSGIARIDKLYRVARAAGGIRTQQSIVHCIKRRRYGYRTKARNRFVDKTPECDTTHRRRCGPPRSRSIQTQTPEVNARLMRKIAFIDHHHRHEVVQIIRFKVHERHSLIARAARAWLHFESLTEGINQESRSF